MAIESHITIFLSGAKAWNLWRELNPNESPDLSDVDFETLGDEPHDMFNLRSFQGYNLSNANLSRVSARNCTFYDCRFDLTALNFSDMCWASFQRCSFLNSEMRVAKIGCASFEFCDFADADLSYCSAEETSFADCDLVKTRLNHASLVKVSFENAVLRYVCIYGASVWDVNMNGAVQSDIIISENGTGMTVPSIELAQFISLLLDNKKVRDFIDTITSKMVLILGRFTPERKAVLDELKDVLASSNYLPVIFDFEGPTTRDVGETVRTLASLSRFVIADLSSPQSLPLELQSIVPHFPSLAVQPLIVRTQVPFGMFESLTKYPWVLEPIVYDEGDRTDLASIIISRCESFLSGDIPEIEED